MRAHALSGDAAIIAGYFCSGRTFDDSVGEFAIEYADQNRSDYRTFVRAIKTERIKAKADAQAATLRRILPLTVSS